MRCMVKWRYLYCQHTEREHWRAPLWSCMDFCVQRLKGKLFMDEIFVFLSLGKSFGPSKLFSHIVNRWASGPHFLGSILCFHLLEFWAVHLQRLNCTHSTQFLWRLSTMYLPNRTSDYTDFLLLYIHIVTEQMNSNNKASTLQLLERQTLNFWLSGRPDT